MASYARASVELDKELRYWRAALLIEDTSLYRITKAKKDRHVEIAKEYWATPIGRLFDSGASRTGHPWLTRPRTLRGGEYVTAAKMVSENLPTRMNVTRGRGQGRRECRRCRGPAETQMHALNECRKTRDAQIRRYNWVCKEICEQVLAGDPTATVLSEHRVTVNGEEYRPDLVIVRGCQATVVDVAVCYDNRGDRLRARYHEKLRKYEILRDSLGVKLSDGQVIIPQRMISDVVVDAFVIGTRGLMLPETCRRPLERLGIKGDNFMRRVQEGVIRGSVMVWRTFTTC